MAHGDLLGHPVGNQKGGEMDKSIVVGVDGSLDSKSALDAAARLADRVGARLVLANVVEHMPTYAAVGAIAPVVPEPLVDVHSERVDAAKRLLEEMAEEAELENADTRVVTGFAAERLADLADEEDAELIVVGSRGRGAFRAAFLGSVSTSP
jgi:nucleotide-binding universal stress UspA family protein